MKNELYSHKIDITRVLKFAGAGVIGFLIDGSVFFALQLTSDATVLQSKIIAASLAICITWLINRSITFKADVGKNILAELTLYFMASLIGATANILATVLISHHDKVYHHLPAYCFGTFVGLIVNYFLYSFVVFPRKS